MPSCRAVGEAMKKQRSKKTAKKSAAKCPSTGSRVKQWARSRPESKKSKSARLRRWANTGRGTFDLGGRAFEPEEIAALAPAFAAIAFACVAIAEALHELRRRSRGDR